MQFKFETDKKDYSDFASGRVFYNAPKTTAFPIRLASEIMARCLSLLQEDKSLSIYDPCCGGAHLLTAIGYLYHEKLNAVYGTDIDKDIIEYAKKNLSLLTGEGLFERKAQIQKNYEQFNKDSHLQALESMERLMWINKEIQKSIRDLQCYTWDITGINPPPFKDINLVISDIPYGNMVNWQGSEKNHVQQMLANIYPILDCKNAVLAIISDKSQKVRHRS